MTEPLRHGWSTVRFCGWCKRPFPESRREQLYCNDTHKRFARRERSARRAAASAAVFLLAAALLAQVRTEPLWQQLPPAFLTPGGKATIPAPDKAGDYWLTLRYEYSVDGVPQEPKFVSRMFTVIAPPPPSPTEIPPPTPTPCVVGIYGYPSGYRCYDCAGRVVPGAMPIGTRCGPAPTVTPVLTRTPTPTPTPDTSCVADDKTLCLNAARFAVQATWKTLDGQTGQANAVPLTSTSGYFWFFTSDNLEIVVKVLGPVPQYWVFAAGLTDVEVEMTVTDTATAQERIYKNAQGTAFAPIQDTSAFPTGGPTGGPGWTLAGAIAAILVAGGGAYYRYRKTRIT